MVSEKELLKAIKECEQLPESYQNCEKLANLITVYDHYYGYNQPHYKQISETVIQSDGSSEFMNVIKGKNAHHVWNIINELMDAVKVLHPRMYDSVVSKIENSL